MIIGSFNIRWGGGSDKRRKISQIVDKGKADIILLQETKLKSCSDAMSSSFWRAENIGYSVSDSEGLPGGLLILWKVSTVEVLSSFRGSGFLGIKFRRCEQVCYIVNIYSACSLTLKRVLWSKLVSLKSSFNDGEWIIRGILLLSLVRRG